MQFKYLLVWASILLCVPGACIAQETTILEYGAAVHTLAYSPVDSSLIAVAGTANVRGVSDIKIWNLQTNRSRRLRGHTDTVNSVAFSPSGRLLASGSDDGTFRLWDLSQHQNTVTKQHVINGLPTVVKAVAFSPDERRLVTAGVHVKVWSVRTMKEIVAFRHRDVSVLAFSPDGKYLAVGENNSKAGGRVKIWDFPKRKSVAVLEADSTSVTSVAFSPDNQTLASGERQGHIKLWTVSDWQLRGTISRAGPTINSLDFTPDSKTLAAGRSRALSLWSAENGNLIAFLPGHEGAGVVWATAFSNDGREIASGSEDGLVRIQNIENRLQTERRREMIRCIYFVPKDRTPQKDMTSRIDTVIKGVQQFYAEQLENYGHDRKTFMIETDAGGIALVHQVAGRFNDEYYREGTLTKVLGEIVGPTEEKYVNVVIAEISELIDHRYCGLGAFWGGGGRALVLERCMSMGVIAHELGHAFGLEHDFRSDNDIMSYGFKHPLRISKCAARWLDGHRFFNPDQTAFNAPATIRMLTPLANPPRGVILRFKIDDADGLHHSQLLGPTVSNDPSDGIKLYDCKMLSAESEMIESIIPQLPADARTRVTLRVIDTQGNFSQSTFPVEAVHIAEEHSDTPPFPVEPFELKIVTLGQVKRTALFQNFPNPFNPETWLPYQLARDANVHIAIYDAKGALVRLLDLDWQAAGVYTDRARAAHWDGSNNNGEFVANGIYYYQLRAGDHMQVRRMAIRK